mgnify:FL=1
MDTYKIKLTMKAKNDYKRIIRYIKFNLNEPKIAEKYAILIKDKINSLESYPHKFEIIKSKLIKQNDIRKMIINNCIVLYKITEQKKEVVILRILYNTMDWKDDV